MGAATPELLCFKLCQLVAEISRLQAQSTCICDVIWSQIVCCSDWVTAQWFWGTKDKPVWPNHRQTHQPIMTFKFLKLNLSTLRLIINTITETIFQENICDMYLIWHVSWILISYLLYSPCPVSWCEGGGVYVYSTANYQGPMKWFRLQMSCKVVHLYFTVKLVNTNISEVNLADCLKKERWLPQSP